MRVMVTGSRTYGVCPHEPKHEDDGGVWLPDCPVARQQREAMIAAFVEHRLTEAGTPIELIHGDQVGADRTAASLWYFYGLGPITAFPYVKELGGYGGHARNDVLVAHMPDLVLAFHLNHSPGTADAIARARKAGLDVHVYPKENQS
jgi:hypothetical protein